MPIRSKLGRSVRLTAAGVVAALAVMATPAVSLAAPTPSVSTGSATLVQASTATLNGSINPQGQSTTYFFEYGHTRSYGYQTVVAGAGAGNQTVHVSVPWPVLPVRRCRVRSAILRWWPPPRRAG